MPAHNLDKAVGHESKPLPVAWNQRDLLLYAVGIGAKKDELAFTYEDDPNWHAFPTYPLVLGLKGTNPSIANFATAKEGSAPNPGLPPLDPKKLVHAEQSIEILGELPKESTEGWALKKKCVGVKDTGKGLIVDDAMELVDPSGKVVVRMISSGYCFGKFDTGGFQKSIAPKQPVKAGKPPQRNPDFVFAEKTTPEQAAVYRLSGDYNPLHIDDAVGKGMGFPGVILHGLCSYGHAARAIVKNVAKGDGRRLKYMSARFTSPVLPGDELETTMWVSNDAESGGQRVDFVQKIKGTGKVCLGGGVALIASDKHSKL
ncbi:hypothetical protein NBRC10513v2_006659 [Rhodotorula toruloides]|uniref:FGENESH: predicted gene_10.142 protein n=1 Tax=Rhodotorula toruloides TaxID=5286 RepID=A0A0K3CIG3_RHOTO|nr:peroxisomal dehydratase [Rhodotorula toruloides]